MLYTTYLTQTCVPFCSHWKTWGDGVVSHWPSVLSLSAPYRPLCCRAMSPAPWVLSWESPYCPARLPLPLGQWLSTRGHSVTGGHAATSGDVFRCHNWRWGGLLSSAKHLTIHEIAPTTKYYLVPRNSYFKKSEGMYKKWIWTTVSIYGVTSKILRNMRNASCEGRLCRSAVPATGKLGRWRHGAHFSTPKLNTSPRTEQAFMSNSQMRWKEFKTNQKKHL